MIHRYKLLCKFTYNLITFKKKNCLSWLYLYIIMIKILLCISIHIVEERSTMQYNIYYIQSLTTNKRCNILKCSITLLKFNIDVATSIAVIIIKMIGCSNDLSHHDVLSLKSILSCNTYYNYINYHF
jgi:hypothetical protein